MEEKQSSGENHHPNLVKCTSYDIVVGCGLLKQLGYELVSHVKASNYFVISDETVWSIYGELVQSSFTAADISAQVYCIPPGESSKSRTHKAALDDWLASSGADRKSVVVAIGGGVVGDLAGYVAATFMRGIGLVHVPTTLLAMVDSSIGGKTAIDTPLGKNLVGAFHRPRRIIVDTETLRTLPRRQVSNGMAEVIKAGAIRSASLFMQLEMSAQQVLDEQRMEVVTDIIRQAIQIKVDVVEADEKEAGLRAILNFGHTVGHGIEALLAPDWLHGECVAVGMVKEAEIARALGPVAPDAINRLVSCLEAYELPVKFPSVALSGVMRAMSRDKKNSGGVKHVVLLKSIGDAGSASTGVSDEVIECALAPGIQVVPGGPIRGEVEVPGSKSISNRVLLMAALSKGTCTIRGLLHSEDTKVMIAALRALGVPRIDFSANGQDVIVEGAAGVLHAAGEGTELFLANAGTAFRFLTTACTLARPSNDRSTCFLTGVSRMQERPVGDLVDALRCNGCHIEYARNEGYPPLKIHASGLKGGLVQLSAKLSSQYVSSILISAPYAESATTLELVGNVVSRPYIDMTIDLMKQFGVQVVESKANTFFIPNTGYTSPQLFQVECDASSSSYPLAMAAITGGHVTVRGLGSDSLQGDAGFVHVLEQMGCTVQQDATSTTVQGPPAGQLKPIQVDMSSITDTFMTAAVVMATAHNAENEPSVISNVANQRIKECNRLEAMVEGLSKCGVRCEETDTGLRVFGTPHCPDELQSKPVPIRCFKDHRIAMSFAVLGCAWPSIAIMDKECVGKTYPSIWDDMRRHLGVRLVPYEQSSHPNTRSAGRAQSRSSIIIIGMRSAGKSTLGSAAAKELGMKFVDLDSYLETKTQRRIPEIIRDDGWESFRDLEGSCLGEVLKACQSDTIIACGGGVVERASNRAALKSCDMPVVFLDRHIDDILLDLSEDENKPAYAGASAADVYKRRLPWFEDCSTHQFTIPRAKRCEPSTFSRFCRTVTCGDAVPLRDHSNFVCLTLSNYDNAAAHALVADVTSDAWAAEVRADMLGDCSRENVARQLSLVRTSAKCPLIFTVRTKHEGGQFSGTDKDYFALLRLAAHHGITFIDVETGRDRSLVASFVRDVAGTSRLIGSAHFAWPCTSPSHFVDAARAVAETGALDVIKVVFTAASFSDCWPVFMGRQQFASIDKRPVIALAMGPAGALTRALNTFMAPVTDPRLTPAAPGQLTWQRVKELRQELGLLPSQQFYIFGKPIRLSPSPLIHNTAFQHHKLPFQYGRYETDNSHEAAQLLEKDNTAGATVTIPLKEALVPFMHSLSPAASQIGAINTIVKCANGDLHGDNTDWIGIRDPLLRHFETAEQAGALSNKTALIVGAGGTARAVCFALKTLGFHDVYIWNRTLERAAALAEDFKLTQISTEGLTELRGVDVVVSTIPPAAPWTLPDCVLAKRPVVFDVVYLPRETNAIKAARLAECPVLTGLDMFLAQGLAQSQIFCQAAPPSDLMKTNLHSAYNSLNHDYLERAVMPNGPEELQVSSSGQASSASRETILERICRQRAQDVVDAKQIYSLEELKSALAGHSTVVAGVPPAPLNVMKPLDVLKHFGIGSQATGLSTPVAVMAEIKRASPSKGDIAPGIDAAEQAFKYAMAGAKAVSVLTEPSWFKGTLTDLYLARQRLDSLDQRPALLRKDFIIDEYQVYEARLYGADMILLIVAVLDDERLISLMEVSRSLGMEPLVEVATEDEMKRALAAGATIIGINNRNLKTFDLDSDRTCRLMRLAHQQESRTSAPKLFAALSGISERRDVQRYVASGCRAVLVGESLMRSADPSAKIAQLRGEDTAMPLVKLCGIRDERTAASALMSGADALGFVFAAKSKRYVEPGLAKEVLATTRRALGTNGLEVRHALQRQPASEDANTTGNAAEFLRRRADVFRGLCAIAPISFGVFANQPVLDVASVAEQVHLDVIQLSGTEGLDAARHFDRNKFLIVKAVHISDGASAADIVAQLHKVPRHHLPDAILLDTKSGAAHGGTGATFDWSVAEELSSHGVPFFLAGGLTPENVSSAVRQVAPFALDVSSGIETGPAVKDVKKMDQFVAQAKSTQPKSPGSTSA